MPKFAGIKNNNVCIISDLPFVNNDIISLEIPIELEKLSFTELVSGYRIRNNKFIAKSGIGNSKEIRLALVGNWKMKCGIATYSENLWPELINRVGDYKLFIEKNDKNTGPINLVGTETVADNKIVACWKRGEPLSELATEIKNFDPDIILIQHEFGIWPNARHWLSLMTQLINYRVIVVMHSIFYHLDKLVCEASMPEIIVHLNGAKDLLQNKKKILNKIHVIPHGCYPVSDPNKLWNIYKSEKTFLQFGFGFRYKNWESSIQATAILKKKYPDVFFTGLFSESDNNKVEHQVYFNELISLIDQLDVKENVALIRGYQSDVAIDAFLRTNQAAIFPYVANAGNEVFGASGAARMAMAKGLPVITSFANHFSDLPTIKADTPDQLATELDMLFSDWKIKKIQIDRQLQYLKENSWAKISEKYLAVFEGKK